MMQTQPVPQSDPQNLPALDTTKTISCVRDKPLQQKPTDDYIDSPGQGWSMGKRCEACGEPVSSLWRSRVSNYGMDDTLWLCAKCSGHDWPDPICEPDWTSDRGQA